MTTKRRVAFIGSVLLETNMFVAFTVLGLDDLTAAFPV